MQGFTPYSVPNQTGFVPDPNRNPNIMGYPQQQQIYQPANSIPGLPGRIVENGDVLRTMEIPFDGNVYYFPKADGTEIYTKRWLPNGSTQIVRYVMKTDEEQQEEENALMNKLNGIEEQLQQIQKTISFKPNFKKNNNRKEVENQ